MSIKKSRPKSFVAVALVYIFGVAVGVVTYMLLPYPFWLSLLLADVAATVFTFAFSCIFKNASVYDPYWSVQPVVILVCFALFAEMTPLRFLLLSAVIFWGIRLTANWAYTFKGLLFEDWRYVMLSEKTGWLYPFVNFCGIHMVPTLIVYLCTLPAVFAFVYDSPLCRWSVLFVLLSFVAAFLQGIADVQMHSYRKNRNGPFIRVGLWKRCRHPNYLGEILMWWGVGLAVVFSMPERWYLLAGALANTLLFLIVSIPMADRRQAGKEGFCEYKKETGALFPKFR